MKAIIKKLKQIRKYCKERNECMNCIYKKGQLCIVSDSLDMYLAYADPKDWQIEKMEKLLDES